MRNLEISHPRDGMGCRTPEAAIGVRNLLNSQERDDWSCRTPELTLMRKILLLILFCLALPLLGPAARAQAPGAKVLVLTAEGPLTPAMLNYLERGLRVAEESGAQALILQLNTPGGSITLMNQMVQRMRASPAPGIVYVAPRGAMAGSA